MAYAKDFVHQCRFCGGKATKEVFNCRNSSHGFFCAGCARREVERLWKEETNWKKEADSESLKRGTLS